MNTHADKKQENKSQSVINAVTKEQSGDTSTFQFVDKRPEAAMPGKLQEIANNSPKVKQANHLQAMTDKYSTQEKPTMQMKGKLSLNDDVGLEKDADLMGSKALQVDLYKGDNFNKTIARSPVNNIVQRNDDETTLGNFPINPIDFHVTDHGDERIQEIIKKLADKENLREDDVKYKCMSDDQQWIGRGYCDKIFGVYEGSGKNFNYRHRTTGNTWNHVAEYSNGIINDASWKQFFTKSLEITRNLPPIFKGTADELRNYGLPKEDVESYLDMFGIGDNSKPDSLKYHYNVDREHELRKKEDQNLKNLKILNKRKNRNK